MDVRFVARNAVIDDELRSYMREKVSKLASFLIGSLITKCL